MSKMRKFFGLFGSNKAIRDGNTTTNAELDEEMEKVFAMSDKDEFDLAKFTLESEKLEKRQIAEKDFVSSHRKKSYPHIHIPLRTRKRRFSEVRDDELDTKSGNNPIGTSSDSNYNSHRANDEEPHDSSSVVIQHGDNLVTSDGSPILSERAAVEQSRDSVSPDRKVQFDISLAGNHTSQSYSDGLNITDEPFTDIHFKRKHTHHKKPRKHGHVTGDSIRAPDRDGIPEHGEYKIIQQPDESLQEFLHDDLTSHRFDCSKEKRRFSTKSVGSLVTDKRGTEGSATSAARLYKKYFDHIPHKVFVQLDELSGTGEEQEWKERARWIKYEEDVEEGADRWGRPHVGSLSFHSMLNLRRCLESGVVMLDLEEKELPSIVYRAVNQMAVDQIILEEHKPLITRALLLKHRHVNEHDRFRFIRRNTSSYTSLQNINEDTRYKTKFSLASTEGTIKSISPIHDNGKSNNNNANSSTTIDMKEESTYSSSNEDISRKPQREKENILKRIPAGAESIAVLVGNVDFLPRPTAAFIRLAEAILLPSLMEIPIPVRFLFILLGPATPEMDFHEVGRSISTLMTDSDFNTCAYKATDRKELLSAINLFLDFSIVLPLGNWEREGLISLKELKSKTEAIRRRRSKMPLDVGASSPLLLDDSPLPLTADGKQVNRISDPNHPLIRTRRPFGGLINDIKRRWSFYKSDFVDGIDCLCFSAAIFMYFAALSAAITFGGLMAGKTDNSMGISETLVATSLAGILFGMFSAQPLLIIGTTGPLLLFDESLFNFCKQRSMNFLTTRVYIGLWLFIISLVVSCAEGSVAIKVFTRFTEEIFSSLISMIYIWESLYNCYLVFKNHPITELKEYVKVHNQTELSLNSSNIMPSSRNSSQLHQPNTALFCTILTGGTFILAYLLKAFRNSKFLGRSVRRALGDFGVPISIITFSLFSTINSQIYTDKLFVPGGLSPSKPSERGWLILPVDNFSFSVALGSVIPASLVYILLFMETHISELIIGKKERKLKKGCGFHFDIVLVCLANVFCGFLGAPWMCAATVRSVAHVSSVTIMSRTHAPGDAPHIIEVKEQRVSALIVSTLVGLSVLMGKYLEYVPMAVLFGVFLYMGISSIQGIQIFDRIILILMPSKHHPPVAYVRKVRTWKIHLFTTIQLISLGVLWTIKSSFLGLLFPFFLLLMIPLRKVLNYFYLPDEMLALDSNEPDDIDRIDNEEPDFYEQSLLAS